MIPARFLDSLPQWRRALRRRRRLVLLLFLAGVVAAVAPSLAPASARTAPVLVAVRELPAGSEIGADDVRPVTVAAALVPEGALSRASEVVGTRLQAPVAEGQTLLARDVRAGGAAPETGREAVVVPVDAALVSRLQPGVRVDVVFSTTDPSVSETTRADVLSVGETPGGSGTLGDDGGSGTVPVVVAVEVSDTPGIAYATREGWVLVAIVG